MPFDHFGLVAPIFSHVGYSSLETILKQADLPTPGRVLDTGGGTGRVANVIREYASEVVVVDPSMGMLREADQTNLWLACSNSEALPFPESSFERIIMVDALHHVIHHGETAREMYRVLKPGGRIVIEEPDIRKFGVKLIALAEKLLLMRSHFLSPQRIVNLFSYDSSVSHVFVEGHNAWVVIKKPV